MRPESLFNYLRCCPSSSCFLPLQYITIFIFGSECIKVFRSQILSLSNNKSCTPITLPYLHKHCSKVQFWGIYTSTSTSFFLCNASTPLEIHWLGQHINWKTAGTILRRNWKVKLFTSAPLVGLGGSESTLCYCYLWGEDLVSESISLPTRSYHLPWRVY